MMKTHLKPVMLRPRERCCAGRRWLLRFSRVLAVQM